MTGLGIGQAPLAEGRLEVEVRSLNHRFVEIRVRLPTELFEHAFFLEQSARELVTRGRYDVTVRIEGAALPPPSIALDRARAAFAALQQLRDELAPGSQLSVGALATIPELFTPATSSDTQAPRAAIREALAAAVADLASMREREGRALLEELDARLEAARRLHAEINRLSPRAIAACRQRLSERLERLLSDHSVSVDPGRLEAELAIMADKADITEELVRLQSHFDQFGALARGSDAVGRRLEFLLQEVGREVNTIGAKCQDAELSHLVVELKAEVERMREQVQNVE